VPYTIEKDFTFSASHVLEGLPEGHQCGRLHGHNYVVRLRLRGTRLQEVGFLYDYGDMRPFGHFIDNTLDHRHLNDVMASNPTAEALAQHLAVIAKGLLSHLPTGVRISVGVSETPKTWAWWEPS
jgi:6-pyruvoyltetrahydropterin/6-carboxytetrahydropterin synthase